MQGSARRPGGTGAVMRSPVVVAGATALAVSVVLVLAVWVTWSSAGGGAPSAPDSAALSAQDVPTPTPRAIRRSNPAAAVAPTDQPDPAPTATSASEPAEDVDAADTPSAPATDIAVAGGIEIPTARPAATKADPTAKPEAAEPEPEPEPEPAEPEPTAPPENRALLEYGDADGFAPLVAGNWQLDGELLVFGGTTGQAEPWLIMPAGEPGGDYAVEVEIRAKELVLGFCNQNFGIAAGSAAAGTVWGAGVLYPCNDAPPVARLTDVTDWTNGYDSDRELAAERFDPKNDWHRFRFEIRGSELTLLIDGETVVEASDDEAAVTADAPIQIGVWSQGVRTLVREVAVYEL